MSVFSERIKALRAEKGRTMREVATEIGLMGEEINYSTISRYEAGKTKPSVDDIRKLAYYYNVSADYLVGLTDDRTPAKVLSAYKTWMEQVKELTKTYSNEYPDFVINSDTLGDVLIERSRGGPNEKA